MADDTDEKAAAPETAKTEAPQPKKLPPEAMGRLQMATMKLQLAREAYRADLAEIERDYDFRMTGNQLQPDGTVVPAIRPRPIPPAATENIRKQAPRSQKGPAREDAPPSPPVRVPAESDAPPPEPEHGKSNGASPPG